MKLFLVCACSFLVFVSCDSTRKIESDEAGSADLEIEFTSRFIIHEGEKCGVFYVVNHANKFAYVNIDLESSDHCYYQPVFDKLENGEWVRVEVGYGGGVVFSKINPGDSAEFMVPVDLIDKNKDATYRLIVMGGGSVLHYSAPFKIAF